MRFGDFTFAFPAVLSAIMLAAVVGPRHGDLDHRDRHLPDPDLRPRHPRIGQCDLGAGVRARRARIGQGRLPHHSRARAAEHPVGPDRAGDDPVCAGDPGGGGIVLSRPWHPAAAAVLGPHAERRADVAVPVADACVLSGSCDRSLGARPQSAWATDCAICSTPGFRGSVDGEHAPDRGRKSRRPAQYQPRSGPGRPRRQLFAETRRDVGAGRRIRMRQIRHGVGLDGTVAGQRRRQRQRPVRWKRAGRTCPMPITASCAATASA